MKTNSCRKEKLNCKREKWEKKKEIRNWQQTDAGKRSYIEREIKENIREKESERERKREKKITREKKREKKSKRERKR